MRTLYGWFIFSIAVFFAIQVALYNEIQLPSWVVSYVNDFLCMPIVLTICLKAVHVIKGNNKLKLPLLPILVLTTFYAFYFELYLPERHPRYTADLWDVVMYFTGSFLFYFLQFQK